MNRVTFFAAAALLASAASPALATTINFVADAQTNGQRAVNDTSVINTADLGGLNLRLVGGAGGATSDFGYLNSYGNAGGLGVCTALTSSGSCNPFHDDSVSPGEYVRVEFVDAPFNVQQLSFSTELIGSHGAQNGNTSLDLLMITTSLNGVVNAVTLTFAQAASTAFGAVDWIQFDYVGHEFWVSSISDVPAPAALPLLLSGLVGLGFAARRKKQSA